MTHLTVRSEAISALRRQFPRLTFLPVGSRVTCDPAPEGTDQDWLVYAEGSDMAHLRVALIRNGWVPCGREYGDEHSSAFRAYREGDDNIIVTDQRWFYDSFKAATQIAKRLNLLEKEDRSDLFNELRKHWPRARFAVSQHVDLDDEIPF